MGNQKLIAGAVMILLNLVLLSPIATSMVEGAVEEEFETYPYDSACANSDCTEVSRIFESINEDILYSGERSKEIILFEIFFGSYIRKEQYNIYEKICDEISNGSNYNIYQLLMGRGKTSVILPLVALKYILPAFL